MALQCHMSVTKILVIIQIPLLVDKSSAGMLCRFYLLPLCFGALIATHFMNVNDASNCVVC